MHDLSVVALGYLSEANDAAPRAAAGADAEALHDFRVAVRRLRSWIRAFEDELGDVVPKKQRERLAQIADATNPGRDLQVQLEWLKRAKSKSSAWMARYLRACAERGDAELRAVIEEDFAKTYDTLNDALSSFDRDVDATLHAAIGKRIEPFLLAVTTSLDGVHSVGDERAAHKARIRVKRLRYLIEPLKESFEEADELVDRLKSLQDALGRVHDAHVLSHALRDALERAAVADVHRRSAAALGDDLVIEPNDSERKLLADCPRSGVLALMRHLRSDLDRDFAESKDVWAASESGIRALVAGLSEKLLG